MKKHKKNLHMNRPEFKKKIVSLKKDAKLVINGIARTRFTFLKTFREDFVTGVSYRMITNSRKVFKNVNLVRVLSLITNLVSFFNNTIFFKLRSVRVQKFLCFPAYLLFGFLFTVNSKYFFNS